MKAPTGARKNHLNRGTGRTDGLAATHHTTRLEDPEDITGEGNPGTDETLFGVHQNKGRGGTHGMAATHDQSEKPDPPVLPVEGAGMED